MSLSKKAKQVVKNVCTDPKIGAEVAAAIDASGAGPADNVTPLGSTTNMTALVPAAASISGSAGTYAAPSTPTGAEVDTAIDQLKTKVITALGLKADNVDAETLRTEAEARLDAIEAKIDLVIAKLIAASLMSA